MSEKNEQETAAAKNRDERVAIPLDPEEALRGLLKVDPGSQETTGRQSSPSSPSRSNKHT